MEKYADNLEELVIERTGQLIEEKKKTDALLERMLPRCVHLACVGDDFLVCFLSVVRKVRCKAARKLNRAQTRKRWGRGDRKNAEWTNLSSFFIFWPLILRNTKNTPKNCLLSRLAFVLLNFKTWKVWTWSHFISRWSMNVLVITVVLNRAVVDRRFDNLCGSHL